LQRRKRQNIIIIITASVGIILILSALWIVSKEHRFKKYQNDQYGFSIKYPASWALKENVNEADVIFYSPVENELDFFRENVNVVVQDISGNPMNLEEYSETAIEQMEAVFGENLLTIESGPTYIAKQGGYKYVFIGKTPETELKYMTVWLIRGLDSYQLTYTSLASQYDQYLSKVKRMFKSFRID